ncbi:MAG: RidA family protein, partial [Pseudomonadota bacterium]
RVLVEVGGELSDIVEITTWFTDRAQLPAIQKERAAALAGATPVSTSVMVAGLGDPAFLVELTPVAVVPEARFRSPAE